MECLRLSLAIRGLYKASFFVFGLGMGEVGLGGEIEFEQNKPSETF